MGHVARMGGGEVHKRFWWGNLRERATGRLRRRWENNIKMDLQEVNCGMGWIDLAQNRDRSRVLVNVVMNLRVP